MLTWCRESWTSQSFSVLRVLFVFVLSVVTMFGENDTAACSPETSVVFPWVCQPGLLSVWPVMNYAITCVVFVFIEIPQIRQVEVLPKPFIPMKGKVLPSFHPSVYPSLTYLLISCLTLPNLATLSLDTMHLFSLGFLLLWTKYNCKSRNEYCDVCPFLKDPPFFVPRSFAGPPIEDYPVQFPPSRPTANNLQAICLNGDRRPRYSDSYFPASGFGQQRQRAKAVNNLEAWYGKCCEDYQTGNSEQTLCCATQAVSFSAAFKSSGVSYSLCECRMAV